MAPGILVAARSLAFSVAAAIALNLWATSVVAQPADAANTVTATRIVGDQSRTRFIADLTDEVAVNVFSLADPYRIIIDLPEVHFRLASGTGNAGFGLISAYRFGLISRGQSRVVLDASEPVEVANYYVLAPVGDEPARLVVDLVPTTREAFLADALQYREATEGQIAAASPPLSDNFGDGRLVVVIDPGHGGIDPGAIGGRGVFEKDVVLVFSLELAAQLRATGRYEVLMTRETDTYPSLTDRVEFARASRADIFLSIHADSFPQQTSVRGAAVFTVSERASTQMVADLAARENRADILAGLNIPGATDEVFDILIDFARRETKNFSIILAREIIDGLEAVTELAPNPQQEAGFVVLKAPDVPSVLVELGFLTNSEDEEVLQSSEWRQRSAATLVAAIGAFFETRVAGFAR
ncbi:MAG: N-acetylmuramoyl-L-alanine amidase [Alphaproteobacteria bacterium]